MPGIGSLLIREIQVKITEIASYLPNIEADR